jgi:hypothetical protein
VVAIALLLAGCGSHSGTVRHVSVTRPGAPIWCPTARSSLRQSAPNARSPRSFDTRTLLGLGDARAAAEAQRQGCTWRVISRDGHNYILTADLRLDRVDAALERGIVVSVGVY